MPATEIMFVPIVIFLVAVAPLWLMLHYWSKSKQKKGISMSKSKQSWPS
ncbi:MAG: hypothetical protein HRU04_16040 [Oceanospirillaceae bacterium]|nr:hypothetical protein [Oceanospirillaceae bacterium]